MKKIMFITIIAILFASCSNPIILIEEVIAEEVIAEEVIAEEVIAEEVIAEEVIAEEVTVNEVVLFGVDNELVYASEKTLSYTIKYSDGVEVVDTKTFTATSLGGTVVCTVDIDGVVSNIINLNFQDMRLVTGSPWNYISISDDGVYTYIFNDNKTFDYQFISNSDPDWNLNDSGFWETKNSLININGIWLNYTINEDIFNFNNIIYTK